MAFRDRFFTPQVARAITSPSAILLAGAGTALGIIGGGVAVGVVAGALAYGARVAVAVPRARQPARVDPSALRDPWRRFVREALDAKARYDRAVRTTAPGPLRERLDDIGARLDDGVHECWRIAQRGQQLEDAESSLEPPDRVREKLDDVERDLSRTGNERLRGAAEALRAQLEASQRLAQVAADARDRLRLLDARLDEMVARAVELSLKADDPAALGGLGTDVNDLVTEMESLRQALEDTTAVRPG